MELTKLDDSASSRIKTETVSGRFVRDGYRVRWIEWDSAFRDTDLQIGDVIVALNHEPYHSVDDGKRERLGGGKARGDTLLGQGRGQGRRRDRAPSKSDYKSFYL